MTYCQKCGAFISYETFTGLQTCMACQGRATSAPAYNPSAYNPPSAFTSVFSALPAMTLRQWYAGLAMQGICAASPGLSFAELATNARMQADVMIAELEKQR